MNLFDIGDFCIFLYFIIIWINFVFIYEYLALLGACTWNFSDFACTDFKFTAILLLFVRRACCLVTRYDRILAIFIDNWAFFVVIFTSWFIITSSAVFLEFICIYLGCISQFFGSFLFNVLLSSVLPLWIFHFFTGYLIFTR